MPATDQQDLHALAQRFNRMLNRRFLRPPDISRGRVITPVKAEGSEQIIGAILDVDGKVVKADAPTGAGLDSIMTGQEWELHKDKGSVLGGKYRMVTCTTNPMTNSTDNPSIYLPVPIIEAANKGSIYTFEGRASAIEPGGSIRAALMVFPRSTKEGWGTLYDWAITGLAIQTRKTGEDAWSYAQTFPLQPSKPIRFALNANIDADDYSFAANVGGLVSLDIPYGVPQYWRIGTEVVLARYTFELLTVVEHDGIGEPMLNQGFDPGPGGRGQDDTEAVAHVIGETIELLNASIRIDDLQPGQAYQFRVAAVAAGGRQGPYSEAESFDAWEVTLPPAAPVIDSVDQLRAVIRAKWDIVTTDSTGADCAPVRRYVVVRHTAALAAGLTLAAVLSAGATLFDDNISSTSADVPNTHGTGNYIGIAAVNSSGLMGEWAWAYDNVAPPSPDPAQVIMNDVQDGITYHVPESSTSLNAQTGAVVSIAAHKDPGFYEYVLLVSGTNTGASATVAGRSKASSDVIPVTGGVTGWYKLVAADGAGNYLNSAAPNNAGYSTGWKFIFSRFAEIGLPPNGNFQVPNTTDTQAKGWTPRVNAFVTAFYQNTGGKEGNRVYRYSVPNSVIGGGIITLESSISRIIPAGTGANGYVWLYQDSGIAKDYLVFLYYVGYATDDGSGATGGTYTTSNAVAVSVPNATWTRLTLSTVTDLRLATDRSGRFVIDVRQNTAGGANPHNLYVDAAKMTFN